MSFFPLNVKLAGRRITIIGGGAVAERKIAKLIGAGASVRVVAPDLTPALSELRDNGVLSHVARPYQNGDVAGSFLAIAATNDKMVNKAIAEEAARYAILSDICDAPNLSSFTMPAVIERGDLVIAISTGGKSPALAKKIRQDLEDRYGPEYASALRLLGALREKLLTAPANTAYNKTLLSQLADYDLPRLIKERRASELESLILRILGFPFSVSRFFAAEKDPR